jgi:hypothetical protein
MKHAVIQILAWSHAHESAAKRHQQSSSLTSTSDGAAEVDATRLVPQLTPRLSTAGDARLPASAGGKTVTAKSTTARAGVSDREVWR